MIRIKQIYIKLIEKPNTRTKNILLGTLSKSICPQELNFHQCVQSQKKIIHMTKTQNDFKKGVLQPGFLQEDIKEDS